MEPVAANNIDAHRQKVDILLVDDNPAKMLALQTALEPLGENLIIATSGQEALRLLLSREFATVLLDVNMPGMDGFETAQLMRSRRRSAHTPVIFVSAISLSETDALRGYSLGAVDYICAPIIPEILRAKVSVFVNLHKKTEEAREHAAEVDKRTAELKDSQSKLRLAERMAALGTLSAGLGHDMGNLLLPIQMRLDSLELDSLTPPVLDHLRSIRTCVDHLNSLAKGLRLLSLDPESGGKDESTDLADWWPQVEPLFRNALPRVVSLEWSLMPGLPPVLLAPHLLTQIVFNLVQNAGDAMGSGIQHRPGKVQVIAETTPGGSSVRLCVTDNGPGMTPDVRRRCLEPFFTTKARGLSTGLGLALVHSLVQRAGGVLSLDSELGRGTSFSFMVPMASPPSPAISIKRFVAVVALRDMRLRSYASTVLRSLGFETAGADRRDGVSTRVWVVDADDHIIHDATRFVRSGNGRRALVLGRTSSVGLEEHIEHMGPNPGPADLRQALHRIAAACVANPAPRPVQSSATDPQEASL
ncbi:MAG: hybrid sensor histidine kinase/response regulator [Phycisphaerales bacterium]|nr:hybrid sensor histidine kinase/response regulator [Phycisphaerales bacterium]